MKEIKRKYNRIDPTFSWNRQLAHTPFPKRTNTLITTIRFIRFVAKISVFNPKLPANGQRPKKTKESVTFFICSPFIDRTNKESSSFSITWLAPFLIHLFFLNGWDFPPFWIGIKTISEFYFDGICWITKYFLLLESFLNL